MIKVCIICDGNYYSMGRQVYCSSHCRAKAYYKRYSLKPLTRDQAARKKLYAIRSRANRKKVPFNLTVDELLSICEFGRCHYCKHVMKICEVDRKVPSVGYVVINLVPSCRVCNTVKNNILTYNEMMGLSDITKNNPLGSR